MSDAGITKLLFSDCVKKLKLQEAKLPARHSPNKAAYQI